LEAVVFKRVATSALWDFEVVKKRLGRALLSKNAAVSCVNQRKRLTQHWTRPSEERKKKKPNLAVLLLFGWVLLQCFLAPLGVLLVMKALKDEQYVVIKAYEFTVFEIWRDFNVLSYIACPYYPYIRIYRLYDGASVLYITHCSWELTMFFAGYGLKLL